MNIKLDSSYIKCVTVCSYVGDKSEPNVTFADIVRHGSEVFIISFAIILNIYNSPLNFLGILHCMFIPVLVILFAVKFNGGSGGTISKQ